jgi:hypothetical protein
VRGSPQLDPRGDVYNPAGIMLANLRALFGVVVDIILLRRGPEHLPASTLLLAVMIGVYLLVDSIVASSLSMFIPKRLASLVIGITATLVWYQVALSVVKKRERFTQLLTALFAVSTVFTPLFMPLVSMVLAQQEAKQQPSAVIMMLMLAMLVWAVVVYVRVVRSAFEWPWPAGLLMIIGQECFTLLIFILVFGGPQAAA